MSSGHLAWITRENANYVIMIKRLGSDYDSPKHISFVIMQTRYIFQRTSGPLGLVFQGMYQ